MEHQGVGLNIQQDSLAYHEGLSVQKDLVPVELTLAQGKETKKKESKTGNVGDVQVANYQLMKTLGTEHLVDDATAHVAVFGAEFDAVEAPEVAAADPGKIVGGDNELVAFVAFELMGTS